MATYVLGKSQADPYENTFQAWCEREGVTEPNLPVVKPNGKTIGAPRGVEGEVPKVKIKVVQGKLQIRILYWKTFEKQVFLMRCFGLSDPEDIGMALRMTLWERVLPDDPDAYDVERVLRYLHALRPSSLLAASRALQLYIVQETITDTRSLIRGTFGDERHKYVKDLDKLIGCYGKAMRGN